MLILLIILLILFAGAAWIGILTHVSLISAFKPAILPFLPGDALKVITAASLATAWTRLRRIAQ